MCIYAVDVSTVWDVNFYRALGVIIIKRERGETMENELLTGLEVEYVVRTPYKVTSSLA